MSLFRRPRKSKKENSAAKSAPKQEYPPASVDGSLEDSIRYIKEILGENEEFTIRRFHLFGSHPAALVYFTNMVDQALINTDILKPCMKVPPNWEGMNAGSERLEEVLLSDVLHHCGVSVKSEIRDLIEGVLRGETVVIIEGLKQGIVLSTRKVEQRSIDQPATEQVIRGPREGFIESLSTNISLIRYRLQTPDFHTETMKIGSKTQSKVAVCYMKGITNPDLLGEVRRRLSEIEIDAILDSGYLEQFIEDHHFSPFPQVQYTERPDKVVANLLEGRIAILVDGSPLALVVPTVFSQFYQTVEDYTERFVMMSAIRMARLIALIFSLIFPALYVAIISFNPELIPTEFAVAVAGGRAGVPFPAVIEVLVMEISMEVLREATIRLPQQVGGALSIVGVLVVGQAAVEAGFVSPITVVIIAMTTIGSFATPAYNAALALRLLRFPLIILAGTFGLYGIMVGFILIANHLLSLKSFGVPFLSPLVPGNFQGMKDVLIRGPLWWMKERPNMLFTRNRIRVGAGTGPEVKGREANVLDPLKFKQDEE